TDIDFLEVITEHYTDDDPRAQRELEEISSLFPVIPHGISLSIGSMTPLDQGLLRGIKRVCEMTQAPYYSEHLCMTSVPGIDLGHLSPLWFTEDVLQQVIRNVTYVQDYLARPLILENVTYYFDIPGNSMSQVEFFNRLIAATGCGILLDITNVFINSVNHGFDPLAFLDQMPLDHVVQVHLAGGYWFNDYLVDGHSEPVQEESWELLRALATRCRIKGVIFEHDRNFPDMELLLRQIQRAKHLVF
ncbi:MAG: DUF692 domain-containing protein, partial [Ktedonobacteraceae bacterium]|nr:DUF692 domain-containing protein [Ktedonobacteraceae bacterium]